MAQCRVSTIRPHIAAPPPPHQAAFADTQRQRLSLQAHTSWLQWAAIRHVLGGRRRCIKLGGRRWLDCRQLDGGSKEAQRQFSTLQGPRNVRACAVRVDALCESSLPSEVPDGGGVKVANLEEQVLNKAADSEPSLHKRRSVQAERSIDIVSSSLPADVLDAIRRHDPAVVIEDADNVLVMECWRMRKQQSSKEANDLGDSTVALVGVRTLQHHCKATAGQPSEPPIELLFVTKGTIVPEDVRAKHVFVTSPTAMRKLAGLQVVSGDEMVGFVARENVIRSLSSGDDKESDVWLPDAERVLVLDAIEDPGNMGALLRSASAFGWDSVVLLPGCCNPLMKRASIASRGAHLHLPMAQASVNQLRASARAHDMQLICACAADFTSQSCEGTVSWDAQQQALWKEVAVIRERKQRICLVLGNERSGISDEVKRICDKRICIPMVGNMESLNVSVAGGILLYLLANG